MEHKHKKIKFRRQYNNVDSYDDEIDIVLHILEKCKIVERELIDELAEVLKELVELYHDQLPLFYKNDVFNEREWQKLVVSLSNGRGSIETRIKEVLDNLERKTRELHTNKTVAWLMLEYEWISRHTAKSIGVNPNNFFWLYTPQAKREAVTTVWCSDGKSLFERIIANTQDMDKKLRQTIIYGLRKGWSTEQMAKHFRDITGVAASKASRLLRTETMAVFSKATKEMYLENGIEYIEIIGDAICGGICLEYVGEAVPLRDAVIGIDLPPYHPNCACSFCSYTEFEPVENDE